MNARRASATAAGLLLGMALATAALAQNQGGILRVQHRDSPASMSILEEGTISAIMRMMGCSTTSSFSISMCRRTGWNR
jgi:hypothetical protein